MPATWTNDDRHIVVDCPQCHRTIWAGSKCHHGQPITSPSKDAPKEDVRTRSGGLKRRKGDDMHGTLTDD